MANIVGVDWAAPKLGTWWVQSKIDPRWNATGRAAGLCTLGRPPELNDWLRQCKEQFGTPPADCEAGFMKD